MTRIDSFVTELKIDIKFIDNIKTKIAEINGKGMEMRIVRIRIKFVKLIIEIVVWIENC
jgi:hypothetical protein